jgi:hypothetical protein
VRKVFFISVSTLLQAILVACCSHVFAQIPAGSILWLSADYAETDSLQNVKAWPDKNDSKKSFFPPNDTNAPALAKSSINGHNSIRFNGSNNYLEGPNIYPVQHDYTISAVIKVKSLASSNNIFSGINHALWLNGTSFPNIFHGDWRRIESSSLPIDTNVWVITASYNRSSDYATFYINGYFADSNFVGVNFDSTAFVGAYQRSYFYSGDIAEIVLYDRVLTKIQRDSVENYFFNKYAVLLPSPEPNPEQTFTVAPARLQFYPRESDDSGTVRIKGVFKTKGFDSISVDMYRDTEYIEHLSQKLNYDTGGAAFHFAPRIHAQFAEYRFVIRATSSIKDSVLAERDSIVCGDVYFICGQSNAVFTTWEETYKNEYCRTFGYNWSQSIRDTLWNIATATVSDGGPSVGCWGLRIGRSIIENHLIPVAIINGGVGGTKIEQQLRNNVYPLDMRTVYGSMLYRAQKSGLAKYAKAMFWYQGESNTDSDYYYNFKSLYDDWLGDYPFLQKIYVMQIRPGCLNTMLAPLREVQRTFGKSLAEVVPVPTVGIAGHLGCHFSIDGYHELGDQTYRLIDRDFYGSTDTIGIEGPSIDKAFFTDVTRTKVGLLFKPKGVPLVVPGDTIISSLSTSIKDYFYIGGDTGSVSSISTDNDTLFLSLSHAPLASTISYLPDVYYNDTNIVYEGPWLKNSRGVGAFSFWNIPILKWSDMAVVSQPYTHIKWEITPNPSEAGGKQIITLTLDKPSTIILSIFDELGRELAQLANGMYPSETYRFTIPLNVNPNQILFARLRVEDKEEMKKIITFE